MPWSGKRETGLKGDAPYHKDNLRESQIRGPTTGTNRSPEIPMARGDENYVQLTIPFDHDQEPHDD
jgi:hypothetical protein